MIMDVHVHIIEPEHFNLEVYLSIHPERMRRAFAKYSPSVKEHVLGRFPVERYLRECEGYVDGAVLLPVKIGKTWGLEIPNTYMRGLAEKYPGKLWWCCAVNPWEEGAADEVERCVKEGAIGIGELGTGYQAFDPNDKRCYPVWEKAEELDVPVVIHPGPSNTRHMRLCHSHVAAIDEVAIKFPNVRFLMCHLGWPTEYKEAIYLMQKHENVFGDFSFMLMAAGLDDHLASLYMPVVKNPYWDWVEPLAYYFSRNWGFINGKLLAGTDYPTVGPDNMVRQTTNLNQMFRKYNMPEVPQEALREVLEENWKRVFTKIPHKK